MRCVTFLSGAGGVLSYTPPADTVLVSLLGTMPCVASNRNDLSYNDWVLGTGLPEGAYEGGYGCLLLSEPSGGSPAACAQSQLNQQVRGGEPIFLACASRGMVQLLFDDSSAEVPAEL
jgi:hypothetical protein